MIRNSISLTNCAHALGWTLLHFCWQGALVAILLAYTLSLLSRRSAHLRYIASCSALFLLTALPLFTFLCSVRTPGAVIRPALTILLESSGIRGHGALVSSEPPLFRVLSALDHSLPIIVAVWGSGVVLFLGRLVIGLLVAHRMKSTAIQTLNEKLQNSFDRLRIRLKVHRSVQLLSSSSVQVPTLIGWLRPVVLLPLNHLSGLSTLQLEAIFAHELAHIRRHDYLVSVLQSLIEGLFFYHPAVWWISANVRRERENCCDDIAVAVSGNALTYARALSLLEEARQSFPAPILAATGGVLTMRIKRLLNVQEQPRTSRGATLAVLLTMIAVSAGTIARAQRMETNQAIPPAQITTPLVADVYQKWLDQDVRWIIAPPERAVFLQLPSDTERDHFIQQFWQRRDAPGAPEGSTRQEHYRRISYANEHFNAENPGWETDRGRTYIVYGPPESIDSHPGGSKTSEPFEVWNYDNALGLGHRVAFTFVDNCRCGGYQLQYNTGDGSGLATQAGRAPYDKISNR